MQVKGLKHKLFNNVCCDSCTNACPGEPVIGLKLEISQFFSSSLVKHWASKWLGVKCWSGSWFCKFNSNSWISATLSEIYLEIF